MSSIVRAWYWVQRNLSWFNICRQCRFWWQRRTRGWDDSETWNLDEEFGLWLLPRLKRFKQVSNVIPPCTTEEEWDAEIDEMIFAANHFAYHSYDWDEKPDEYWERLERAMGIFAKHIGYLWW